MSDAASGRQEDSPAHRASKIDRIAARKVLIRHLANRVWCIEPRLEQERGISDALERELRDVYASTSWRITRPLRWASPRRSKTARFARQVGKGAWWTLTLQLPMQLRRRRRALAEAERKERESIPRTLEHWFELYETLDGSDVTCVLALRDELPARPLVSVIMPVYNPPERIFREALESVRAQIYDDWELCVVDDASTEPHVRRVLAELAEQDERVRVVHRTENGGISAASNDALALARGEILVLLDHDDLLRPHSLVLVVSEFVASAEVGYVYSDLIVVDSDGRPIGHYFKPDWSPTLLTSQNCLGHVSAIRTDLVRAVGGFRSQFDGSQDWDLALRVTERLSSAGIVHIPRVLYLWRAIEGSVAEGGVSAKPYAVAAARRATEDHLKRVGATGYVVPVESHQSVRLLPTPPKPLVEVVVPSTGPVDLLRRCIDGVLSGTNYEELRLTVVVPSCDDTATPRSRMYLREIETDARVRVVNDPLPLNFARIVNDAMAVSSAPLALLLNDHTEVVDPDWLEYMVGYAAEDRVGAIGARLLYPDGSIQSAGMLVGAKGAAGHLYQQWDASALGYSNRIRLPQDLTAVSGACMLMRREAHDDVGGWDAAFPLAYCDVDFCLRLGARQWRVVYVPDAVMVHHESSTNGHWSDGAEKHGEDLARLQARWGESLRDDPMHNPNLQLDSSRPDRLAFPPRSTYPWRRRQPRPTHR